MLREYLAISSRIGVCEYSGMYELDSRAGWLLRAAWLVALPADWLLATAGLASRTIVAGCRTWFDDVGSCRSWRPSRVRLYGHG